MCVCGGGGRGGGSDTLANKQESILTSFFHYNPLLPTTKEGSSPNLKRQHTKFRKDPRNAPEQVIFTSSLSVIRNGAVRKDCTSHLYIKLKPTCKENSGLLFVKSK